MEAEDELTRGLHLQCFVRVVFVVVRNAPRILTRINVKSTIPDIP
jgi:hypothetical protein